MLVCIDGRVSLVTPRPFPRLVPRTRREAREPDLTCLHSSETPFGLFLFHEKRPSVACLSNQRQHFENHLPLLCDLLPWPGQALPSDLSSQKSTTKKWASALHQASLPSSCTKDGMLRRDNYLSDQQVRLVNSLLNLVSSGFWTEKRKAASRMRHGSLVPFAATRSNDTFNNCFERQEGQLYIGGTYEKPPTNKDSQWHSLSPCLLGSHIRHHHHRGYQMPCEPPHPNNIIRYAHEAPSIPRPLLSTPGCLSQPPLSLSWP